MPVIAAKCPNCNGDIQLDDTKRSGFCMYCGSQVLVQDAIDLAKVKVDGAVTVEGVATLEKLVQNGAKFLELGEYRRAKEVYGRITNEYPEDYRGWWGAVCAATQNFDIAECPARPVERNMQNALRLAPKEIKASLQTQYDTWIDQGRALNESRIMAQLTVQTGNEIARLQDDIRESVLTQRKRHGKRIAWLVAGLAAPVFLLCNIYLFPSLWLLLVTPVCLFLTIYGIAAAIDEHKAAKADILKIQDTQRSLSEAQKNLTEYQQRLADAKRRLA